MRYPEARVWRTSEDLIKLLTEVDQSWLEGQGTAARHWYERKHHPDFWKEQFATDSSLQPALVPTGDPQVVIEWLTEGQDVNRKRAPLPQALLEQALQQRPHRPVLMELKWLVWLLLAKVLSGASLRWWGVAKLYNFRTHHQTGPGSG